MARLFVLLAAVCFGTTGTAQAFAPEGASPTSVGAVRIVLGGALLAVVAVGATLRAGPRRPSWGRRDVALTGVAALGVAAYQPAFFTGAQRMGVAAGTLVALASAPVVTGVLEWLLLRRRPSTRWALATALAATGVAVLAGGRPSAGGGPDVFGAVAALAAGTAYAVYTVASKRLLDRGRPPAPVMGAVFGSAAILLLPVLVATDSGWLHGRAGASTAVFLAVVPTALAYLLFARGLRRLSAAETATLTLAEPVTAGLLGLLVLGEAATGAFWVGGAVLLAGLTVLAAAPPARTADGRRSRSRDAARPT